MASWSGPGSFGGGYDGRAMGGPWRPTSRGQGGTSRRRTVAAVLLFAAVILSVVAAASPWWFDTVTLTDPSSGASDTGTLEFSPGSTTYVACSGSTLYGWAPCNANTNVNWAYASTGLSNLGGYYVLVHVMILVSGVLGALCASFMVMGATRRGWGRWHFHTTHLLALMAGILTLLAPALLILAQPGLVGPISAAPANSGPYDYFLGVEEANCGTNTPNASFWNTCSFSVGGGAFGTDNGQATWGAGLGWYLSICAGFTFVFGGALFLSGRPEGTYPDGREEGSAMSMRGQGAGWGAAGLPGGPSSSTGIAPLASDPRELAPTPTLDDLGPAVTSNRTSCRTCGHLNPPGSVLCTRCHAAIR